MVGTVQPLVKNVPITNPDGTPTEYLIRWAQEKQIDISEGITAEQAEEITQQYVDDWAANRDINAGTALSGGGNLSSDVTINYDGGIADQNDVDLSTPPTDQQVLVWDDANSKWIPADQSGGGSGGIAAYVQFVPGTPPTVLSSSGVASVTRNNTGRYRITFSTAFPNEYYGMASHGRFTTAASSVVPIIGVDRNTGFGKTTTTIDVNLLTDTGTPSDNIAFVNLAFFHSSSSAPEGIEVQSNGSTVDVNTMVVNFKGAASLTNPSSGVVDVDVASNLTASDVTNTPSGNISATTVQSAVDELDAEKVAKAGDTMTGSLTVPNIAAGTSVDPSSPLIVSPQARVISKGGQNALVILDALDNGASFTSAIIRFRQNSLERWVISQGNTAVSNLDFAAYNDSGAFIGTLMSFSRANFESSFASPTRFRSYTRTTVPSTSIAGQVIYVSNATGGASLAFSNGTNWISAITGNAI